MCARACPACVCRRSCQFPLIHERERGREREGRGGRERDRRERKREYHVTPHCLQAFFYTFFFSRKSLSALYLYLRSRSSIAKKGSFRAPRRSALFVAVFFFWSSFVTCLSAPTLRIYTVYLPIYLPTYLPTYLSIYISLYVTISKI